MYKFSLERFNFTYDSGSARSLFKGCRMGPWLVLVSLVLGKMYLPHAKLGLFCVV